MLNFYCYICGQTFKEDEETKMTVLGAVHTTCLEKSYNGKEEEFALFGAIDTWREKSNFKSQAQDNDKPKSNRQKNREYIRKALRDLERNAFKKRKKRDVINSEKKKRMRKKKKECKDANKI